MASALPTLTQGLCSRGAHAHSALPHLGALPLLFPLPDTPFPALLLVTFRKSFESRPNRHPLAEATANSPDCSSSPLPIFLGTPCVLLTKRDV